MLKSFPAKVLLFGEYTILSGSSALAIPFQKFSGSWSFELSESSERENSRKHLLNFLNHHDCQDLDVEKFRAELDRGLWFQSNIPQGYGIGSSGALVAAIYDYFAKNKIEGFAAQKTLAHLESFFHGSSSGLDPLVSYLQKPLKIIGPTQVEIVEPDISKLGLFLVNTHRPRQTGPLVSIYKEKLKDSNFKSGCSNILGGDVNSAIEYTLSANKEKLFHHFWHISKFQWDYFQEMIPDAVKEAWRKGLDQGDFALKLCGAGGGGLILGMSKNESSTPNLDIIWP